MPDDALSQPSIGSGADATLTSERMRGLYIGGAWRPTEARFDDFNPGDGKLYATAPAGGRRDAADAIEAAAAAFPEWSRTPHPKRAAVLLKAADIIAARTPQIAEAIVREGGGWFGKGMFECGYVPNLLRAAAAETYQSVGEVLPSAYGKVSMSVRRPLGVVTVISPWNFPLILTGRGIAFAMAAGNTVVLKPSEETPYIGGYLFAEIFEEAGLPPGVLNVVSCSRDDVAEVGAELVENPKVKAISFTGSTAVGREIAVRAARHLKKCSLELGGKDALIVCDDADLERAAGAANFGAFMHQGQICMSAEKILVQRAIAEPFLAAFAERARALKMGDPSADKACNIGPLINAKQAAKVKRQIDDAVSRGARVICGGGVDGLYVEPTILADVTPEMEVFREETFGPVAPVMIFDDDSEAIAHANDCEYGLSAGVITGDERRGLAIAEALESGMCHINSAPVFDEPHVPFGGVKSSGLGRHGGRWAIDAFTETRWITLDRGSHPFPPGF